MATGNSSTGTDIFGNEVGDYAIFKAGEATIKIENAGTCAAIGVNVNYTYPVNPVMTFGKDVIFAMGTPQGTFSFAALAGSTDVKTELDKCKGKTIDVSLGTESQCDFKVKIGGQETNLKTNRGVQLVGAVFNQFSISGQAQDYFFSENVGGVFHYLGKGGNSTSSGSGTRRRRS